MKAIQTALFATSILCSTLVLAPMAKADSTEVLFGGSIPDSCTVTKINDGALGLNATGTGLDSTATGGSAGSVEVTCAGAATVTLSAPVAKTAPTNYNDSSLTLTKTATTSGALSLTAVGLTAGTGLLTGGTHTFDINMSVNDTAGMAMGTYQYGVTLTATSL